MFPVSAALGGVGLLGSLFGGNQTASPEMQDILKRILAAAGMEHDISQSPLGSQPGEQLQLSDILGHLAQAQKGATGNLYANLTAADTPHLGDLKANWASRGIAQRSAARSGMLGSFAADRNAARGRYESLLGQAGGIAGQFPGTPGAGQQFAGMLGTLGQNYGYRHGLGQQQRSPEMQNALAALGPFVAGGGIRGIG